jgi:hypothetical protein
MRARRNSAIAISSQPSVGGSTLPPDPSLDFSIVENSMYLPFFF